MRALGAAARPAFLDDDHVLSFRDAEVLLVDLRSGRVVTTYTAPTPIKSLTVQGTRVFLGFAKQGGGVGVGIVDATTWSPVAEIPVPLPGNIFWQVTPSVDGRTVAVSVPGSSQQQGVLLDLASGAQVGPFWPQQAVIPAALPDGGFLVGSSAGELHRRSATGEQLGSTVKLYNGTTPLDGIVVEGDRAYVAGPAGVAIVSVPLIDGAAGPSKLSRPLRGLTGFTVSATEGLAVAQRTTDGKVLVAHLDRDEDPIALEPSGARSTGGLPALLNVSPDGRLIASAGAAGVLSIFDTATLSLVQTIPYALDRPVDSSFTSSLGDAARRYAVVFWLSSTTAILGTLDSVVAIDLTTGQRRWEARGFRDEVDSLAVSSDGSLVLATDYYGTARLLRSDDGSEVGAPLGNGSMTDAERRTAPRVPVNYVAFVPGGHVALLDDWDSGTIRVVDVDSRTEVAPPMHIAAGTTLLRVSGDGELLAVGGTEGLVRLYDLATRAQIGDPFPSGTNLTSAIFAPDDRAFIERGNPPLVWDIDPASWREKACAVAGRNMTKAEWRQYMPPDEAYRPTCPALPVET
jgi:hypothetical protein